MDRPDDLMYTPYGRVAVYESPLIDGAEPDWSFYGHSGYVGKTPPWLSISIMMNLDLVYIDPELGFGQPKVSRCHQIRTAGLSIF